MELRGRFHQFVGALPVAHRIVIVSTLVALAMLAFLFVRWVTQPSYGLLYGGLDEVTVAEVVDELEAQGVPYRLEGGGSQVLVPRDQLHRVRAELAGAGIAATPSAPGFELLDEQGLTVSDFRQRVDYQRALEGELARTLGAMEGVQAATVHLVIPERELFADRQEPVTASVLLDATRSLDIDEVETVTFLVSSAVEGLAADDVTVADADGTVLHAPGEASGPAGVSNRQLRHTREFEEALAEDITGLLEAINGDPRAAVVVRADLDFDERTVEQERHDPDSRVELREQEISESFAGTGLIPGGAVGVDGGPVEAEETESDYERDEAVREYAVDRIIDRSVAAPGAIDGLSVAIVMDNGEHTGAPVPPVGEVEELVSAALGLDPDRGDAVAVSMVPFPVLDEEEPALPAEDGFPMALVLQAAAVVVLVIVALALFLMTRRRDDVVVQELGGWEQAELPAPEDPGELAAGEGSTHADDPALELREELQTLVEQQPEETAVLLRSWLADRR